MDEVFKVFVANVFQGFYIFSVALTWLSCFERMKAMNFDGGLRLKGEFWASTLAASTFVIVQMGGVFGMINPDEYMTCPISFFVWSVFYNLDEYVGVNIFEWIKKQ